MKFSNPDSLGVKVKFSVMLRELDEFGFTNIFGLDYAEGSVELARSVCENLNSVTGINE